MDEFFRTELNWGQRRRIQAACLDMWAPFKASIEQWAAGLVIVYDKFHVIQHANKAVDEVRRVEFLRQGGWRRSVVKGKRWLLLTGWTNRSSEKRQQLNQLFALNRRLLKANLLRESLERLWTQANEDKAREYLAGWIRQLRWQRLPAFQKLAYMLVVHVEGLMNYYRVKVRFGVVGVRQKFCVRAGPAVRAPLSGQPARSIMPEGPEEVQYEA